MGDPKKRSFGKILWGLFCVVILSIPVYSALTEEAGLRTPWAPSPIDPSREAVRERLISPASAEFPGNETVVDLGRRVIVKGVVDSHNRMGAMIRTEWEVDLVDGKVENVRLRSR